MVSKNNQVVVSHFKKTASWQKFVKTWLNQPARKVRRRNAREAKASKVFPRPVEGLLRPAVHGQTVRYNTKVRNGRGFTLEELKEAGIGAKLAPTIGIAVDHRRKNRCLESLQTNVARLKAFKSKLVLFPRKSKSPKAGDSPAAELATVEQLSGAILPLTKEAPSIEFAPITAAMKDAKAYGKIRVERMNKRQVGPRKKKAEEEAAKAAEAAKLGK